MVVAAIAGATRQRYLQLGIQTVFNTPVAATRKVPWRGLIDYNPNITDPDVDVGSIDPILLPFISDPQTGLPTTGPLDYDSAAIRMSAGLKGGVSPVTASGTSTWTYQVASLTSDSFDVYTVQQADDTEATDTTVGFGGVIDVLEETMGESGEIQISDQWIFSGATLGQNGTDGIVIDATPEWAFAGDTAYYKDSVAGSIGITPWADIHSSSIQISNNLDRKRFQNGSNSRNVLTGYGRGPRMIQFTITASKNATAIAERATFDDTPRVNRFFKVSTTSSENSPSGVPFRYDRLFPARLFEVSDVEVGNNSAIQFVYRGYYDATAGYAYRSVLVNTLSALP